MSVSTLPGRAWLFGDHVPSDHIVASHGILHSLDEIAPLALVRQRPDFAAGVEPGDYIVAGRHFGQSSGRQVAAKVLKHIGVSCILADSVARTFWRNCWEIGLPALDCPGVTSMARDGDIISADVGAGEIRNLTAATSWRVEIPDSFMMSMLEAGGVIGLAARLSPEWTTGPFPAAPKGELP